LFLGEGVIAGDGNGGSVVDLLKETFDGCVGIPGGLHSVFVGGEVIRCDVAIGVV
jgi:hypothetical protein